jgi:hypothetical protein
MNRSMSRIQAIFAAGLVAAAVDGHAHTLRIEPPFTLATRGEIIGVSIRMTTDEQIGLLQFTLNFDSSVMTFNTASVGADITGDFSISNVNASLPFPPQTAGTNENVLIQLFGGGSQFFSGVDVEVAVVRFRVDADACARTLLAFDQNCAHTQAATASGLLCDIDFLDASVATDCATNVGHVPAPGLQLHQNTPNPFNPTTTIRFEVTSAQPVQLRVFDASGRLVRKLLDAVMPSGSHEVVWSGDDDSGRALVSGVYVYQLCTPGACSARRCVLLK